MEEKVISIEGKRPIWATPQKLLEMSESGMTYEQIAKAAGDITRQRVGQLIKSAKKPVPNK